MTYSTLRILAIQTTLLIGVAGFLAGCAPPKNPQEALVEARATLLSTAGLFAVYAMQPFCDLPEAPRPPLCADRQIVREGAQAARAAIEALNGADAVVDAKGVPDLGVVQTLLARFSALVTKARGN